MRGFHHHKGPVMTCFSTRAAALGALVFTTALTLGYASSVQAATAEASKASEPKPSLIERTKKATKKAAHATGEAISDTGKAIDKKVPRTEAYKKKHPKDVPGSGKS
jgi:uncharacterized caspase-like protein